jgi:hypothetical protein
MGETSKSHQNDKICLSNAVLMQTIFYFLYLLFLFRDKNGCSAFTVALIFPILNAIQKVQVRLVVSLLDRHSI